MVVVGGVVVVVLDVLVVLDVVLVVLVVVVVAVGVASTTADAAPRPIAFLATMRNRYTVSLSSPVTVAPGRSATPSAKVTHDEPVPAAYCTT